MKDAKTLEMEIKREQLWAKLSDVWLCELYLVTKIERSVLVFDPVSR